MAATAQEVQSRAAAFLAPIPGAAPAGESAALDPRFEELKNLMAAFDSPAGAEVEWTNVAKSGQDLLATASKDLLIASYTAYALFQSERLAGLAVGIELLKGLVDQYWDGLFPPLKRLRGRGNALDWFVARLEVGLPGLAVNGSDRATLDIVRSGWGVLSSTAREKLDEHCPSMGGVGEQLERLSRSIPEDAAAEPPAAAASDAPPPPAEAAPPADPHPPAAPPPDAPPPAETPPSAPAEAAPAPPPEPVPEPEGPLGALTEEVAPWLEPFAGDAPAGEEPRYEEEYSAARVEIAKLQNPDQPEIEWKIVVQNTGGLLKTKGKCLVMATYLAYAWFQQDGLGALPKGLVLVAELADRYWEGCFPKRERGRGNAMSWMTAVLDARLGDVKLTPSDRPKVLALEAAVKRLAEVVRAKFEENAPSVGGLGERVQRMLLSVPEAKPEAPKPEPPKPAQPVATQTPATAPPTAAPVKPMPTTEAAPSNPEEVSKFLLATGRTLVTAAATLRQAQLTSPTAYRIIRAGLWLHLEATPPADAGGKTQIPALPAPRRQQFATLEANAKWAALIEETESALMQFRFCLDLNRMTCKALDGLGEAYTPAKTALIAEVGELLKRMPELLELSASDGSPLADAETQSWLAAEVLTGGGGGGPAHTADSSSEGFGEVRALMKGGKAAEAMKKAQALIATAGPPRSRFMRRLNLAEVCLDSGQGLLARGMFAALERELRERDLEEWELELTGRCLEGLVRSIRLAAKAGNKYEGAEKIFERLCLVDPGAAARLAT